MAYEFTIRTIKGSLTMSQEVYEEHQLRLTNRHMKGRYTLEEAALMLADKAHERALTILGKLMQAARDGQLTTHAPGENANYQQPDRVREFYEESYWDDLNKWLIENEPRITWRFPMPDEELAIMKVGTNEKTWDNSRLRALLEESILPGVTKTSLGVKYGVSRQRISTLLKVAKDKFRMGNSSSPSLISQAKGFKY